ncbi:MAG: methyl-accepting chemotaxis protein [Pseudomonadota bacterium]
MKEVISLSAQVARVRVLTTIADFRAQIGRVFFFATLRAHGRTPQERAHYERLMATARMSVDRAFEALAGRDDMEGLEMPALAWARAHASVNPSLLNDLERFHSEVVAITSSAREESADPTALITRLLDITDQADALFGGSFAAFLDLLETDLTRANDLRAAAAGGAAKSAKSAMAQINAISRSVRLISLNAAVEAARVGDRGRGFSVIAGEIKTLAEAIASASQQAGQSMDDLQKVAGN